MAKRKLPTAADLEIWRLKFDLDMQRALAEAAEARSDFHFETLRGLTKERRSVPMPLEQYAEAFGLASYKTFKRRAERWGWDLRKEGPQAYTVDLVRMGPSDAQRIERHTDLIRKRNRQTIAARRARGRSD